MISYPFPPNPSAGAVRSDRFARYLPEFGWMVDVITIKPSHELYEDRALLDALGINVKVRFTSTIDPWMRLRDKRPRSILLEGLRSILMRFFSFPDHMLLWVPFAVTEGIKIVNKKPIDAIYTTSPPHSTHLAGLILSQLKHKPWIADFRDPWTLRAYRGKSLVEAFLLKIERIMERIVLKKAYIILANTKANRRNLLKAFPCLKADKVIHLPNSWEEFPKGAYKVKKNELFTIVHAGTFYPIFKPYALLHALAAWRNGKHPPDIPPLGPDIQVILLGSTDAETKRVIHDLGIDDIVMIRPWAALEDARKTMCQADLLWTSLGTEKESSTYVPSKLFEYIAAKRPIFGFFHEGDAAELIRNTNTGVVFTSDEPIPIIKALWRAIRDKKKNGIPYSPNEEIVNEYYARNIVVKLASILNAFESQKG